MPFVFQKVRKYTGERRIWLRATISTVVSQCIDSYIVLYIAFVIGPQQWSIDRFLAIGTVNYAYKVIMAILLIPTLYIAHAAIDRYLGQQLSTELRTVAAE